MMNNLPDKAVSKYLVSICLLIFVGGCFGSRHLMLLQDPSSYDTGNLPEELAESADVITRYYQRHIDLVNKKKATTSTRYSVTILNKEGRKHGRLVLPYDKFRTIAEVNGTLRDKNGNPIRTISIFDGKDFKATSSYSLYDDNRVKVFELYHGSYPYTVEFEYKLKQKGYIAFPNMPVQGVRDVVQYAEIKVTHPSDLNVNHLVRNSSPEIIKNSDGKKNEMRFVFKNLTAVTSEPYDPPTSTLIPNVSISPDRFSIENSQGSLTSWSSFGKWYYELSKDRRELPESVKRDVDTLLDGVGDKATKLRHLYNYLQENTRYVSIQLGIGGWQPFDAEYVANKKYGDCKALTNFMMALAEYTGIETYPVLISNGSGSYYDIKPDFPTNAFNHIVLMAPVDGDTLWMECTSNTMKFNNIGLSNEDRYALAITPAGGKLIKTPAKDHFENRQINKATITLNNTGDARIHMETSFTGNQQENIRQRLSTKNNSEKEKWLQNTISLNNLNLEEYDLSDPDDKSGRYRITYRLQATNYASQSGTRLFVPLNSLNRWKIVLSETSKKRNFDLFIPFKFEDSDSTVFKLPEGYKVESIPETVEIETDFITYTAGVKVVDSRTLVYTRKVALKEKRIEKEHYEKAKSTFYDIWDTDRSTLVVSKI